MRMRYGHVGAVMLLACLATGCGAGPRYVAASTGSKGTVKFLYIDGKSNQGIIKCDSDDAGDLSNCRQVEIVLKEK